MKAKFVGIFVCMLLIVTPIISTAQNIKIINTNMKKLVFNDDEIDQEQTIDEIGVLVSSVADMAQSFKPTLEKLTRVKVKIEKVCYPSDGITLSIRKPIYGDDLTWVMKSEAEIPDGISWVEFDFPDIFVTPGQTYYIVLCSEAGVIDDYWQWRSGDLNNNYYPDGKAWWNNFGVWEERDPEHDFCFKTYGYKPEGPTILDITITGVPDENNPTTNDPSTKLDERVKFEATIDIPPGYELVKTCWSGDIIPGYGNPYYYVAAPGTHGNKLAVCTILFKEISGSETDTDTLGESFKLFFNKNGDEDNNEEPNWFEYWALDEAVPDIDQAYFDSTREGGYGYTSEGKVYITQKASGQHYFAPIVLNTYFGVESFGGPTVKGIDCTAEVIAHEAYHNWVDDQWKEGGPFHGETDSDKDMPSDGCNDKLPDFYETDTSHTRNDHCDTYDLETKKSSVYAIYGDQEYMAMRAGDIKKGIPENDWANPGKQTNPPYFISSSTEAYVPVDAMFTGSYSDQGVDVDSDGDYDYLEVTAEIKVISGGMFNIIGELYDTTSNKITYINKPIYLQQGIQTIMLEFDGLTIREYGENGPYVVTFLLDNDFGNEIDYQYNAHFTKSYKYTDFEKRDAIFTNSYSDTGVDTDNDGLYNYLVVDIQIDVEKAGKYTIEGWLYDNNECNIVFTKKNDYLDLGSNIISLEFLGETISRHMENGPYTLKYLSLTTKDTRCDFRHIAYKTSSYNYNQFQSQDITNPPNKPEIPNGPASGKAGTKYTYKTSNTDPDGDDLWYQFNWDDGSYDKWIGPFPSGETVTAKYSWDQERIYNVRVRARDIFGVMSIWSDPLKVNIPRSKATTSSFWLRIIDSFPMLQKIILYLID